ncbi:ArsR/SmtB family transcription factor [Nocardiopsis sediminis]|uniref:ArsR/SmtB family transcription factor n=1 Tax=Nocardiopsis sediminis TaxID=1778267 RepID=A0ABV8FQ73_9ACTN
MSTDECELLCIDLPHAEDVRSRVAAEEPARAAAERAKALADPTRLRIASALEVGDELCVCDLAWVCGASKNLVSHHARQLRIAGLAASRRDGKLVMYRLTDTGRALLSVLTAAAPAALGE